MWRSSSKRDIAAWTVVLCLLSFGSGVVLVKRFRPAGPVEFKELPASAMPVAAPVQRTEQARSTYVAPSPPPPAVQPNQMAVSPLQPESKPATNRGKTKAEPEAQSVSINQGDLSELEKLPGVGPGIAQKIIDYRTEHGPFQSVDDLRNVKGIGEKRLAKILPFVRL